MTRTKKKLLLEEVNSASLPPGSEVEWQCWQVAGPMDRRPIKGPKTVLSQSGYGARKVASLEHFGGCDPMCVEVKQAEKLKEKSNGKA
jgi:hypothetical protein